MAKVVYTKRAVKDLRGLSRLTARKIVVKIRFYAERTNPISFVKKLNPPFDTLYRFRIGDYRAVFSVGKNGKLQLLTIFRIKHRRDIYRA